MELKHIHDTPAPITIADLPLPLYLLALALAASPLAAVGLGYVQVSGIGLTANDILPNLISERLPRFQFRTVRILFDCTELVLGVLLGTPAGVGTLTAAIVIGPVIQLTVTRLNNPRRVVRVH